MTGAGNAGPVDAPEQVGRRRARTDALLGLQRTAGNRAVSRALAPPADADAAHAEDASAGASTGPSAALVDRIAATTLQRHPPLDSHAHPHPEPPAPAAVEQVALAQAPQVIRNMGDEPVKPKGVRAALCSYLSTAASYAAAAPSAVAGAAGKVTDAIWTKGADQLKSHMAGLGFQLSDSEASQLMALAAKHASSLLVPVPTKDLMGTISATKFERTIEGTKITLDQISVTDIQWWLYNFAEWQGPTLKIGGFSIRSATIDRPAAADKPALKAKLSLDVTGLELAGKGNLLEAVADAIGTAIPKGTPEGLARQEGVGETFKNTLYGNLRNRFSGSLSAKIGGVNATLSEFSLGGLQGGSGSVSLAGLAATAGSQGGGLAGTQATAQVAQTRTAFAAAKFDETIEGAHIVIEGIKVGDIQPLGIGAIRLTSFSLGSIKVDRPKVGTTPPLSVQASLELTGLEVAVDANIVPLVVRALQASVPQTPPADAAGGDAALEAFKTRLTAEVRGNLTGSAKAKIGALAMIVKQLRFGDIVAGGRLSVKGLELGAASTGGLAAADVDVTAQGEIGVQAFVEVAGKSALELQSVVVSLDGQGTGGVTANAVLHDKGLGKLADSTFVRLLLNKNDPVRVTIPINAYKVMLDGFDFAIPKHPKKAWLAKKALDIRVSGGGAEPQFKVSAASKNLVTAGAGPMGMTPAQQRADPVLIPKETAAGGREGAINLRAWAEHVIQGQLDSIARGM